MKMNTLFAFITNLGAKKLFKISFDKEISEQFLSCANIHLSMLFEKLTSLKIDNRTWVGNVEKEDFFYEKGWISKLPFQLFLPHIGTKIIICWQSKSGRIYDIADEDINCHDIEFWFDNLDVDLCRKATNPVWSLLPDIWQPMRIKLFEKDSGIQMSAPFMACLDNQLSNLFTKLTGIKITKRIQTTLSHFKINKPFLVSGEVSRLNTSLIINDNWNPVEVVWKSKSGRIYLPGNEDIDCNDIEFWFENFEAELYIRQYYPNQKLPFKIKDISYELVVTRINLDCTIVMKLRPNAVSDTEKTVEVIDHFITTFNDKSEKRDRSEGVIHNWNIEIKDDTVIYNLDLGSTGVSFFRKILTFLSKMNAFLKVEIE